MADAKPTRPRLVSVGDGGPPAESPSPEESPAPAKRRPVFWLVIVLAVIAVAGFAVQTERVRGLQSRNATLEGELFSTRSALAAYADRFEVVRDTVAGLNAQLETLNSLVSEDPVPDSPPPVAD